MVQENEAELRRKRQVLFLLPYHVPGASKEAQTKRGDEYRDPDGILKIDSRQQWWRTYGRLTGNFYAGLPEQLAREDLDEITEQPLLNYLLALSFTRGEVDFEKNVNLNLIYGDLVAAVYERGYEKRRAYAPIRHMTLDSFSRVLEEIGLAAWHGDGRTTTVSEIEEHCKASGVGKLLEVFQEGAQAGITRLLAAFFFRRYGSRASGDPTFVFTHKSFGEYLTARRLIRGVEKMVRELDRRANDPDEGWEEKEALRHWVQLCGPTAVSSYLRGFLWNEIELRTLKDISRWQQEATRLFNYMLRYGMPMEQIQVTPFIRAMFQSRNAEEALLVALSAFSRRLQRISVIQAPDQTTFGAWFKRIQGQRRGPESALAAGCLCYLDLRLAALDMCDFYDADFTGADLGQVAGNYTNFLIARFGDANLNNAIMTYANLGGADLAHAKLQDANLLAANLKGALLRGADLQRAILQGADLQDAHLQGANLQAANLQAANLQRANLQRADLEGANLEGANMEGANLKGAKGAILPTGKGKGAAK